jgi:hypothetical protein
VVLLDTPFSFYIKTSRARLLLSTSYFEVKVVSLLFRHTLRVHMPAADRHLHSTSSNHLADALARLETPRPRCARSDDESTCLWSQPPCAHTLSVL